ncbi:MAG TPA: thioredoxin domain-containing protein [Gemmatimonadales bacterium]|nr:thioredoxin domain-containing protein [Gemmatimonadales bacterium]
MIRRVFAAALLTLCGAAQSDPLAARSKGRPDAPITIYEMSDFQCPYCRQFTLETMPLLERDYIAPGKARVVYINFPLSSVHHNAAVAAEVAMCAAQQRRFWPMHDLLFRHQADWANLQDPRAYLLALGDSAGAEASRLSRCVASGATADDVRADAERARRAGAASTPTFYIEGGLLEGAAPFSVFRAVLDSIYRSKTR